MQTTRKIVKTYFITVGYVVMFCLISVIGLFVLPDPLSVWIMFFIAAYPAEIAFTALGLFLVFLAYKAYRFIKRTANPWQTVRENLKANLIILFSIAFIIYGCMALLVTILPTAYGRCDHYNEELNGGVKEFQGEKFKINMCGTGGDDNQSNDEIRLQVFNEKGDLAALRHFVVHWDSNFERRIEYHPDHITYYDASLEYNYIKTISMPPTALDWIRARIPLLD